MVNMDVFILQQIPETKNEGQTKITFSSLVVPISVFILFKYSEKLNVQSKKIYFYISPDS